MNTTTLDTKRLIEFRKKLGISKQEAAKRMDMSQPAYLRYESGQRIPSIHVIYVMADILGTSAAYLLGHTNDPKPNRYVVESKKEADLFEIVKLYNESDTATKSRLVAYVTEFFDCADM